MRRGKSGAKKRFSFPEKKKQKRRSSRSCFLHPGDDPSSIYLQQPRWHLRKSDRSDRGEKIRDERGGSIGRDRFILERVCAPVFGDTKKDVSMIACERDEVSAHVFLAKFRANQQWGWENGDLLVWPQFGGLFFSPSDCGNVHIRSHTLPSLTIGGSEDGAGEGLR